MAPTVEGVSTSAHFSAQTDTRAGEPTLVPHSVFYDDFAQGGGVDRPEAGVVRAGDKVVSSLCRILAKLASFDELAKPNDAAITGVTSRFHAIRVPGLSLYDYVSRIDKHFQCSPECYVLALVYIDRILKRHPLYRVSPLNIHRLLVTSIMVAAKFQDDVYYGNDYYAKVAGVSLCEINNLETQFLKLLAWQVNVSVREYSSYHAHMLGVAGEDLNAALDVATSESSHVKLDMTVEATSVAAVAIPKSRRTCRTSQLCMQRHQTRQFTIRLGAAKAVARTPRWSRQQTYDIRRRVRIVVR